MTIEEALKLAVEAQLAGKLGQAEEICRRVLQVLPDHPGAIHFLGVLADQDGRHEESLPLLERAIALNPSIPQFHANYGQILTSLGRLEEGLVAIEKSLAINPNDFRALQYYSVVLGRLGRKPETLAACRKALALKPNSAEGHWNLAMTLLQMGEFAEGWVESEWRMKIKSLNVERNFPKPQWNGQDLSGKTLLLHVEGGHGDGIHFGRYIPMLRDRKAKLILECQAGLRSLFARLPGLDQILPRGFVPKEFDYHIPLPSLPRIFGTRLESIPNSVPYLSAPPDRVAHWAQRVAKDGKLNVGLAWAGSRLGVEVRSRTLAVFAPLAQVPNVRFHSLQLGAEAAQPRPAGMEMVDYWADLHDFGETAALMEHLDLIISVDTSIAHLAGALARPVWVLLPFNSDFRWLLDRSDSPWYPTMQLFRQTKVGDWETPVQRMVQALRAFKSTS